MIRRGPVGVGGLSIFRIHDGDDAWLIQLGCHVGVEFGAGFDTGLGGHQSPAEWQIDNE